MKFMRCERCKKIFVEEDKVGFIFRKAIQEIGGTMPEELPTPDKNIKELEKEIKKVSKMQNKSN